jgi:hypothetical protein
MPSCGVDAAIDDSAYLKAVEKGKAIGVQVPIIWDRCC